MAPILAPSESNCSAITWVQNSLLGAIVPKVLAAGGATGELTCPEFRQDVIILPMTDSILFTHLPGPDRKRSRTRYGYRLTYRDPDQKAVGCALTWEVSGGRIPYQIALERDAAGNVKLHCTCADAVFRAEDKGQFCKHVRGLLQFGKRSQAAEAGDSTMQLGA
jgi:hypothetical protein